MKLFLNFVCVALPLLSVVNSTVSTSTQQQEPPLQELFNAFTTLKSLPIGSVDLSGFLTNLASVFKIVIRDDFEGSKEFLNLMRSLWTIFIIRQIHRNKSKYEKIPQLAFTDAKRCLAKCLFAELKKLQPSHHLTDRQITSVFEKYLAYFGWYQKIRLFTQFHTAAIVKDFVAEIISQLESVSCGELIEILNKHVLYCIPILWFYHRGLEDIPDSDKGKIPSIYMPFEIEFEDIDEIVPFFMDYYSIVQQNQQLDIEYYIGELIAQSVAESCARDVSVVEENFRALDLYYKERVSSFHDQLKMAVEKYFKHKYLKLKEIFSSCSDFNYFIKNILYVPKEWISSISEALSEKSLIVYSASTVEYVSFHVRELLEKSFDFDFFHSSVCVTELLLSFLIKEQSENVREFTFNSLIDFSRLMETTEYSKSFAQKLPGNCFSEQTALCLIEAMIDSSKLYMIFRFNYKLGVELEKSMKEKRVKEALADEKCIKCLTGPREDDPLVVPICSCQYESIHASCYAKEMIYKCFECEKCNDMLYSEQFHEYSKSYDILIADRLAPAVSELVESLRQSERGVSTSSESIELKMAIYISRNSEAKSKQNFLSEQVSQSQCTIKKHSVALAAFFMKPENETLQDFFKRYQEDIDGFNLVFKPHYEWILNQMKEFVKEHAEENSDFDKFWPIFLSNWWKLLKELIMNFY